MVTKRQHLFLSLFLKEEVLSFSNTLGTPSFFLSRGRLSSIMDRSKPSQGRGGKSKTPQFPSDIFALGAKTSRNETGDSKRTGPVPLGSKHSVPGPSSKLGGYTFSILGTYFYL